MAEIRRKSALKTFEPVEPVGYVVLTPTGTPWKTGGARSSAKLYKNGGTAARALKLVYREKWQRRGWRVVPVANVGLDFPLEG
jgi:hypothetical protein